MAPAVYRVGTLAYTRGALVTVMFWMLWADLCLQIMESLPTIIPLQLKWLGAGDAYIGFVSSGLMSIFTISFAPIIGLQSDRHRGPLGRRRPFLLWCTIPVCLTLLGLGLVAPLTHRLHAWLSAAPYSAGISVTTIGVGLITLFAAGYFFFNNYVLLVYQYLIADVVPPEVMGRFVGLYRAIGAVGAFAFNRWLFGLATTHLTAIYAGGAAIYAAAFLLLVWRVKEGSYPPPLPAARPLHPLGLVRRYTRECFFHRFYLKIFLVSLFFWAAWVPFMTFVVFYATKGPHSLGVSVAEFGRIKGWTFLPMLLVFAGLGPVVDRLHPLRVLVLGLAGVTLTYFLGGLLPETPGVFLVWWMANQFMCAIFSLAYLSMFPALFPQEKYGQFFSANQFFFCAGLVFLPSLCGWLLDRLADYRCLYLWSGVFSAGALVTALALLRHWQQLGGANGFVPPRA